MVVSARHRVNVAAHHAHAQVRVLLLQRLDLEPAVVPRVVPRETGDSASAGPSPSTPAQPGGQGQEPPGVTHSGFQTLTSISPSHSQVPTALCSRRPAIMVSRLDAWAQQPPARHPIFSLCPKHKWMHSAVPSSRRGPSLPARKTTQSRA